MHDIIQVVLSENATPDVAAQPGLLAPGYYLALPRRHKNKQRRDPLNINPRLIGPVGSETAARLLQTSCAYFGLDQRGAPSAAADHQHTELRAHFASHPRSEQMLYARLV